MDVYLEVGSKKVFAGGIDWPGWCRTGKDEASALQALLAYAPRYVKIVGGTSLGFSPPADVSQLVVVERLKGGKTTDFGAPEAAPPSDSEPLDSDSLQRFRVLLEAAWRAFDEAVQAAAGKELRLGPRGGGRDLDGIVRHVMEAEAAYLHSMASRYKVNHDRPLKDEMNKVRQAVLEALASAQRGELPEKGPRGGVIWKPRYFVRRLAWHVLDHVWEIEDRIT